MRALKKRRARLWQYQEGIQGEVRLFERAFGIGPSPLAEAYVMAEKALAPKEA